MIIESPYTLTIEPLVNTDDLKNHTWLVIMHASRKPPHIGLLINGNYNSLTIKGHELNIDKDVLIKTIHVKKIETLFVKLIKHPVFSSDFQLEIGQDYIKQFTHVNQNSSCLKPVKLFLQEFYALSFNEDELLFEIVERLKQNQYINSTYGLHIQAKLIGNEFVLPLYTNQELKAVIETERANFQKPSCL
jgi:hypothetical protein